MDRQAPGRIRDAINDFLRVHGGPATVQEILNGVHTRLGEPISSSSVRSYLRLNIDRSFERVVRGAYALQPVPEAKKPIRAADYGVAHFGKAMLVEADCAEWLSLRAPHSIEAVVTDPPYGFVEYSSEEQEKLRNRKGGVWRIPPSFDGHQRAPLPRFTTLVESDLDALGLFFLEWGRLLLPALVPGANVIVASNPLISDRVSRALTEAGLERRGEIIRLVMTMRGGDRPKNAHKEFSDVSVMPRSMWEPWLCFRKPLDGRVQDNLRKWKTGGFRRISKERPFGDVVQSHPTRSNERKLAPHPSLKPQSFLRQLARAVLPLGEGVILDPFAGSGSTLAAAVAVGYESIGIERDPNYVKMARQAITPLSRLGIS
ncbi:MAG TPA: DNA methyltransferase [Stellaceae bacterium]|nr:DNA methyltransferase [Stellaceae bacterium]